jgi:hypothetical protein
VVNISFCCQKGTIVPLVIGFGFWPSRQKSTTTKQSFAFIGVKSLISYDALSMAILYR